MDQILNEIVKIDEYPHNFIDIDEDLLNKHTYRVIDLFGTRIPWGKVKHLYIIGGNNRPVTSCPTGIYVNDAEDWVLVAGASAKKVQTYLERCADPLEQLYILDTNITHLDVHKLIGLKQLILKNNVKLDKIQGAPPAWTVGKVHHALHRYCQNCHSRYHETALHTESER